jgi:hypothetical protein
MELRSHSSVSCHVVAIHGTPTQDERNVTLIYYRYANVFCLLLYTGMKLELAHQRKNEA